MHSAWRTLTIPEALIAGALEVGSGRFDRGGQKMAEFPPITHVALVARVPVRLRIV